MIGPVSSCVSPDVLVMNAQYFAVHFGHHTHSVIYPVQCLPVKVMTDWGDY